MNTGTTNQNIIDRLIELRYLPDTVLRKIFRHSLKNELENESLYFNEPYKLGRLQMFNSSRKITGVENSPFNESLGERQLKYNCGFSAGTADDAEMLENNMQKIICFRSGIRDGQNILVIGGWGALGIYVAEHFKNVKITCLCNSTKEASYIAKMAKSKNRGNIEPVKAVLGKYNPLSRFDRVFCIEIFGCILKFDLTLKRIRSMLKNTGKLFVQEVVHDTLVYTRPKTGMGRLRFDYFPEEFISCQDIFKYFSEDLRVEKSWNVNGLHYHKTCEARLNQYDKHREEIIELFTRWGQNNPEKIFNRWRQHLIARSEMFRYRNGTEWFVSHYLLKPADK